MAFQQKSNSALKLVSTIFYQIVIFSPNDSLSKTIKNVFYFIEKALFVLDLFFPSFPHFPDSPGKIEVK